MTSPSPISTIRWRWPQLRFSHRCLILGIAVVGSVLGWSQHQVYQGLRAEYEDRAELYGEFEESARRGAGITHEKCLDFNTAVEGFF